MEAASQTMSQFWAGLLRQYAASRTPDTSSILLSTGFEGMENPGYCTGSFDGLHHPSDDDDDEMVDIAGATLDFSSTDDVPPLASGNFTFPS